MNWNPFQLIISFCVVVLVVVFTIYVVQHFL